MIHVHILFIITVAVVCFWFGIFTEKFLSRMDNTGTIFVDIDTGRIVFKFDVMPDELQDHKHIFMRIVKADLKDNFDSSDNDNT